MPDHATHPRVSAIVLAAGLSTRMGGYAKPMLPYGKGTIIEHIINVLEECDLAETIVVTGHCHHALEEYLSPNQVRTAFNPKYPNGEMLCSVQAGLQAVSRSSDAAMIVLGDQPALDDRVVRSVVAAFREGRGSIVIPSYEMRRGHPILIAREHWPTIEALCGEQTLRDFMRKAAQSIFHVAVDNPSILRDVDTPEQYAIELERMRVS